MSLTIQILTPEGTLFEGPVSAVFLPGSYCPFEVLPMHAPIISALSAGDIRVREDGEEKVFPVKGGVVSVLNDRITICAEV